MIPPLPPRPECPRARKAWGLALRTCREAAGISRVQLAKLARVADSTIRNLETGRNLPSRLSYQRLLAVSVLRGKLARTPFSDAGTTSSHGASDLWVAPDYDPVQLLKDMVAQLNSPLGGALDPAHRFLDAASVADWSVYRKESRGHQARFRLPLDDLADRIAAFSTQRPIEIWACGAGENHAEAHLLKSLHARGLAQGRLLLINTSPSLLLSSHRYAIDLFADTPTLHVQAIAADFRRLHHYPSLFASGHVSRIVTLFDCTFASFLDEQAVVRSSLAHVSPGDLLVLDSVLSDETAPRKPPRRWNPPPSLQRFVAGPFLRHVPHVKSVSLRMEQAPNHDCLLADVTMQDGPQRTFIIATRKHYNARSLHHNLHKSNWRILARLPFDAAKRSVFVFEKMPNHEPNKPTHSLRQSPP